MRRRYGGYYGRKRISGGKLAVLSLLFWAVSGFIMISFIHGGPLQLLEAKSEEVAKMYIEDIFPTVNRGSGYESREALEDRIESELKVKREGILDEDQSKSFLKSMVGSMFPAAEVLDDDLAEEDPGIIFNAEDANQTNPEDSSQNASDAKDTDSLDSTTANINSSKPVVIIYHTHATESYQPVTEGNFHSLNEYGTVREVGDVLTAELQAKGIQVIHDKTIHDSPSYNQSYTRSLETIKKLIGDNESAKIVIDLHRDAAGYSGNVAKTVSVKKDTIAKYSLVIGTGNPNVAALRSFANQINNTAEEMYPGFGGKIIEKKYKFNQYVSDHHILLEVGNNENTIEQAKLTAKYLANVIANVTKDIK